MGAFASHQNAGVEEVDISVNHAYRYPPKAGNYFSSHFIMGGERFDTAQPEMYLFGENSDLNFLGSKPAPFPYPAPSASEPIRTLKALINIRKESLRFVRVPDESLSLKEPDNRGPSTHFNIEFTFDCDVRCAITVMYFCTEEVTNGGLIYTPRDSSMNSQTYHYKMGANQQFSQVCHVFDPSQYPEESLLHTFDRELMPIVIYCVAEEGEEPFQSHVTIAIVEKHSDGYALKPLKQKLFVDGLCYLLQEIYGIENKTTDNAKVTSDEDPDDNGAECVICMCDLRDTLILPCRHLCLCNCCADSLRYQANNCPICRAPFRALLQIKALQKSTNLVAGAPPPTSNPENGDNIPAGYEAVSLIEALNGPSVAPQQPTAPPFQNMYVQLPQNAIDSALDIPHEEEDNARGYSENAHQDKLVNSSALEDSTTQTERPLSLTSSCEVLSTSRDAGVQMRLSVLIAQESEEDSLNGAMDGVPPPSSPTTSASSRKKRIAKFFKEDSLECISETGRETIEGVVLSRKHRKSSISTSPKHSSVIKETSLCNNESDDIEDLTETLSLLDDLQLHGKKSERESASNSDFKHGPSMSPTGFKDTTAENKSKKMDKVEDIVNPNEQAELQNGATGYDAEGSYDDRVNSGDRLSLKTGRGSSKKAKQKRKSSRKSLGSNSSYTSAQYVEPVGNESCNIPVSQDSQSLPGTPLSTSSAVSRSSEASMSSASSTRALITSRPPQPFSTNT